MVSQMEKSFYTLTSAVQAPLSSTVTVQEDTGTLSRKERIAIILMVLMICLLVGVAVFKDRRKLAGVTAPVPGGGSTAQYRCWTSGEGVQGFGCDRWRRS